MEEANKLSFGQSLDVQTPHQVQGILETKGHHWLTGAHLTKYQALLHLPRGNLNTLNLATNAPEISEQTRSCLEPTDQVYT